MWNTITSVPSLPRSPEFKILFLGKLTETTLKGIG